MSHLHEPGAEEKNFGPESETQWEMRRDKQLPEIKDDLRVDVGGMIITIVLLIFGATLLAMVCGVGR